MRPLHVALIAVVGTALILHPDLQALSRFLVPKAAILAGASAAAAALVVLGRSRLRLRAVDVALLVYLGSGMLSALIRQRFWPMGATWLSQELPALILFWTVSLGIAARRSPSGTAKAATPVARCSPTVADDPESERRHLQLVDCVIGVGTVVAALIVLDALGLGIPLEGEGIRRPFATLGSRNVAGPYVAITIPLAIARVRRWQWIQALQLALLFAAVILTRCRSAWLALLVVSVAAMVVTQLYRDRQNRRPHSARMRMTLATAAFAAAVVCLVPWPGLHWTESSPYGSSLRRLLAYKEGSGAERLIHYKVGAAILAAHPLLGVGPLAWHDAFDEHAHAAPEHHVEGAYGRPVPMSNLVRIGTETGSVGLLAFAAAVVLLMLDARRLIQRDPIRSEAVIASVAALAVALIHGLFETPFYDPALLSMIAVIAGTVRDFKSAPIGEGVMGGVGLRAAIAPLVLVGGACFSVLVATLRLGSAIALSASTGQSTVESLRAAQRWYPQPTLDEQLVFALTDSGRCEEARQEIERALRASPHHVNVLYCAATCAARRGQQDEARRLLRRSLEIEPHRRAYVETLARWNGVTL